MGVGEWERGRQEREGVRGVGVGREGGGGGKGGRGGEEWWRAVGLWMRRERRREGDGRWSTELRGRGGMLSQGSEGGEKNGSE